MQLGKRVDLLLPDIHIYIIIIIYEYNIDSPMLGSYQNAFATATSVHTAATMVLTEISVYFRF